MWMMLFGCLHPAPMQGGLQGEPGARTPDVVTESGLSDTERASPGFPALSSPTISAGIFGTLLKNPSDQPLVMIFWASWCRPCAEELPSAQRVADRHPEIRWLLINVEPVGTPARQTLSRWGVRLPSYQLSVPDPVSLLQTVPSWPDGIPFTLVITPGGGIYSALSGAVSEAKLESSLPR
jgi:thiol-disulfide isomerase/thioredoxin